VASHKVRLVAALMLVWAGVLIAGRLTGYMGSFV
jgi:hypothetical protein